MTPKAPHLPPRSSLLTTHAYIAQVKWVLLAGILSVFAGSTAALAVIAWFMPLTDTTGIVYVGERSHANSATPYNPAIERETKDRRMTVYDMRALRNGIAYTHEALIGHAVLLSTDGWVVLYATEESVPMESVRGVDAGGSLHTASGMVFDPHRHLLYIKFEGTDFPVQSFTEWSHVVLGENVYVAHDAWKISGIAAYQSPTDTIDIWRYSDHYVLENSVLNAGSVVYDEQGRFLGFVNDEGLLEVSWSVQHSFASVVEKQVIAPALHSWRGAFVDGYVDFAGEKAVNRSGFLIEKAGANDAPIMERDIILEINGRSIEQTSFARMLTSLSEPFTLAVLRDGRMVEIVVDARS